MLVGGGGVQQHRFAESCSVGEPAERLVMLGSRRGPPARPRRAATRRAGHGGLTRRSHLALASLPALAFFSAIAWRALDGLGARPPATRCS